VKNNMYWLIKHAHCLLELYCVLSRSV